MIIGAHFLYMKIVLSVIHFDCW